MKVQVNVKTLSGERLALEFVASAGETASELKERIVLAEPNPFPEQTLAFKGKALDDASTLAGCGVEDGTALDFEAKASAEALAVQLAALLPPPSRTVAIEELGLLYSLKYGATVGLVLGSLGKQSLLPAFLQQHGQHFVVEAGKVRSTVQASAIPAPASKPLQPVPENVAVQRLALSVAVSLELPYATVACGTVQLVANSGDAVQAVKDRAAAAAQVPFPDRKLLLEGATLEDGSSLADIGVGEAAGLNLVVRCTELVLITQLMVLLRSRGPSSRTELDNLYCLRHGASATQALAMLGWGEKLQDFLQRQPFFSVQRGCVSLGRQSPPSPRLARFDEDNRKYLQLHARLSDDAPLAGLAEELQSLASALAAEVFLNVTRVEVGGGLAKGTAIPGDVGAEVVLFVDGLQLTDRERWQQPLAAGLAGALADGLAGSPGVVLGARAAGDGSVRLATAGGLGEVRLLISPDFGGYTPALEALRGQKHSAARSGGEAAFVAQRVRFVERQPPAVKATARLLKHWRSQQHWSSDASRPSDDILELVAAHAATSRRPADLGGAVAAAVGALADFETLEAAVWPSALRCYRDAEVPRALLEQRPLVLDPTNPLANLADSSCFESAEMVQHARRGFGL